MIPDEEIREMIRKFRNQYDPINRYYACPFFKLHEFNNDSYEQRLCSVCSDIFKTMPPRSNEFLCDLGYFTKRRYHRHIPSCPCSLYGIRHVFKKISEFMGEI